MTADQVRLTAAVVGLAWVLALVADPAPSLGPFAADDLAAAGGIGAALVVLAAPPPARWSWVPPSGLLAASALGALRADWAEGLVALAVLAWGLGRLAGLEVPVLLVGSMVSGLRGDPVDLGAAAVLLAGLGTVLALAAARWLPPRLASWTTSLEDGIAIGVWAVVATRLGPPFGPAAGALLGAAAVLRVASGRPVAVATAVPGGILLVQGLVAGSGASSARLVLAVLATATTAAVGRSARCPAGEGGWPPGVGLAGALGAWLVLAPATWGWARPVGLDAYQEGVVVTGAAGALAALAVAAYQLRQGRWYARPAPATGTDARPPTYETLPPGS